MSCQNFNLSMGYRQVKSKPTMFVMLSYSWLIPRAYTITYFGLTIAITVFTWWWKSGNMENSDELLLSPSATSLSSPWFVLNIKIVLETCVSIFFMPRSWSICLDERSDFLWFTCIWCKLPPWIRESLFCFLWNHPMSVMHVRSILWSDRLIVFILYVSLAHQATDWFVQGEEVSS